MIKKINNLFFQHDGKVGHIKSLDGLRGFAILIVLLAHTSNENLYAHEGIDFKRFGYMGVHLFFILSAYLLDKQIVQALRNYKASSLYWKNYFLRRFLRIYPLFIMSLLVFLAQSYLGGKTVVSKFSDIPLYLLLIKTKGIFWSIAVEFKYYFISPLLLLLFHYLLKWNIVKITISLATLILLTLLTHYFFNFQYSSIFNHLSFFIFGTFIAVIECTYGDKIYYKKSSLLNALGFCSFLALILLIPSVFEQLFGFRHLLKSPFIQLAIAIAYGFLLISIIPRKGVLVKLFELKFLRFLGICSYSLYLFHLPVLAFIKQLSVSDELKFFIFFPCVLVVSSLTYLLVEKPLSKIRLHDPLPT